MPANALAQTVARYNSLVEAGNDADFGKLGAAIGLAGRLVA
jgi:hypothetical protein